MTRTNEPKVLEAPILKVQKEGFHSGPYNRFWPGSQKGLHGNSMAFNETVRNRFNAVCPGVDVS